MDIKKITLIILAMVFLAGCSQGVRQQESDDKLVVVASVYPVYDFALKIGGDRVNLSLLTKTGGDAHDWEPTARDISRIGESDVFIYNGAGMEHWISDALQSIDVPLAVDTSENLDMLDAGEHDEEHGHSVYDPHIWLSPINAKAQMRSICDALVKADSVNSGYYEANYAAYAVKIDELDNSYRDTLAAATNRKIVVPHMFYAYLCRDYGLEQISVKGFFPDQEPDPASISKVIEYCAANNIRVVFYENPSDTKLIDMIAREAGAATDCLYPLESLTPEQELAGEEYFSIMRHNLVALERALC